MNSRFYCGIYPLFFGRAWDGGETFHRLASPAQATQANEDAAAQNAQARRNPVSRKHSAFASVLRRCNAVAFAAVAPFAPLIAQATQKNIFLRHRRNRIDAKTQLRLRTSSAIATQLPEV
jgi:hypothetical protein